MAFFIKNKLITFKINSNTITFALFYIIKEKSNEKYFRGTKSKHQ